MRRQNTVGMLKCVKSRASKLFTKRCIRSDLKAKASQFFLSSVYVALLSTTGYKLLYSSPGGGGYSHTLPIRVCAAQRGRDFEAPDLERGIHFRSVF